MTIHGYEIVEVEECGAVEYYGFQTQRSKSRQGWQQESMCSTDLLKNAQSRSYLLAVIS